MLSVLSLLVSNLVTHGTESHQILGRVIAQLASSLNVVDLKIFHAPTPLTTKAISFQDLVA